MPVTIGPFTNVPASGDGVTTPWAQQLTQYAVDNVYPAPCQYPCPPANTAQLTPNVPINYLVFNTPTIVGRRYTVEGYLSLFSGTGTAPLIIVQMFVAGALNREAHASLAVNEHRTVPIGCAFVAAVVSTQIVVTLTSPNTTTQGVGGTRAGQFVVHQVA